jgi:hypothetical protein
VGETRSSRVRAAVAASRARPMRTKGLDAVEEAAAYASRPAGRATIMRVTRSLAKVERGNGMRIVSFESWRSSRLEGGGRGRASRVEKTFTGAGSR